jgi:hypothetical protein
MTETREVSIIRRAAHEGEIELLRFGVPYGDEDDDVVALGLFRNTAVAERDRLRAERHRQRGGVNSYQLR